MNACDAAHVRLRAARDCQHPETAVPRNHPGWLAEYPVNSALRLGTRQAEAAIMNLSMAGDPDMVWSGNHGASGLAQITRDAR